MSCASEVCRDPSHQYGLLHRLDRNTSGPRDKSMIRDRYPIQPFFCAELLLDFKEIMRKSMDIQVAVKYSNWPQIYGKLYVALFGCNITMLVAGRWVSLSYSSWKVSFWPPTRKLDCFPPIISSCYVLCREGKSGYCQLTKKNLMRPWREILVGKPNPCQQINLSSETNISLYGLCSRSNRLS